METIGLTLRTLPTEELRLIYLERRVAEQPNDMMAWLYLADHYLYVDLDRTIHAWQNIANLRPTDESASFVLLLIREMNTGTYQ